MVKKIQFISYEDASEEEVRKLEERFGFKPGELEAEADAYERGEWPEGKTIRQGFGRPPMFDEPTCVVSGRVALSTAEAFDAKAKANGQTRAERVRALVMADVASGEN